MNGVHKFRNDLESVCGVWTVDEEYEVEDKYLVFTVMPDDLEIAMEHIVNDMNEMGWKSVYCDITDSSMIEVRVPISDIDGDY